MIAIGRGNLECDEGGGKNGVKKVGRGGGEKGKKNSYVLYRRGVTQVGKKGADPGGGKG